MAKAKTNYADVVRKLIADDSDDVVMISVDGTEIPVKRPDSLELARFMDQQERDTNMSEIDSAVGVAKMCLPEGLSDSEVFKLMMKARFMDENSAMHKAVMQFMDDISTGIGIADEASENGQTDGDF